MSKCRVCGNSIAPFMSFGKMPIANGFLTEEQFDDEYFFDLQPAFCDSCKTVQIVEQPNPEKMFHGEYAFFSRTSKAMVRHFSEYASWVKDNYLEDEDPFVVELGSNDGIMLENFAKAGIRHLGVEPSANVATEASTYGVESLVAFFGPQVADDIVAERGHADALMAANVMCHIPDINGVGEAARRLLKPRGILVFEDPYLGAVVEKTSYDQIYDEHVFIFSATSVSNIFGRHGFELIDVKPQTTHGGSMRYVLCRKGERETSPAVSELLQREQAQGLNQAKTYDQFRRKCERNRDDLVSILRQKKEDGVRVVGYAATSKSTTVLNYCGIGPDLIEFISDTTPIKQGKFSPGMHIPVRAYEQFKADYPDYAVLFAWNHQAEIMANETAYTEAGGKWISFVPRVAVQD